MIIQWSNGDGIGSDNVDNIGNGNDNDNGDGIGHNGDSI